MSCECDLCRRRELHPGVYPEKREEAGQETVDDVYARYYSNDPELADSQGFSGVGTAVAWDNDGKGLAYDQADHNERSKLYNEAAYNDYKSWEEKDTSQETLAEYAKFSKDWVQPTLSREVGCKFPVMTAISTGYSPPGSVFTIEEAMTREGRDVDGVRVLGTKWLRIEAAYLAEPGEDRPVLYVNPVDLATGFWTDERVRAFVEMWPTTRVAMRKQFGTCIRHGRTVCLVCACAEGNANE